MAKKKSCEKCEVPMRPVKIKQKQADRFLGWECPKCGEFDYRRGKNKIARD